MDQRDTNCGQYRPPPQYQPYPPMRQRKPKKTGRAVAIVLGSVVSVFVIVLVAAAAVGGKTNDTVNTTASVKHEQSQSYSIDFVADRMASGSQLPSSVNLAPGDVASGTVTVDVPTGQKPAQLVCALNMGMFGNSAEWSVS